MKSTLILTALVLVLGAGAAQAQLIEPDECGTTREEVAGQIMDFAADTVCGGAYVGTEPLFLFKGERNCIIQEKLARKLDADPVRQGKPRRGAATKVLQAKDETAIGYLQDFIDGIDKSQTAPGAEGAAAQLQMTAAVFRDFCVPGLAGQPPVE
jgi:hypothetical protein